MLTSFRIAVYFCIYLISTFAYSDVCNQLSAKVERLSNLANDQKYSEVKALAFDYLKNDEHCLSTSPILLHKIYLSILSVQQGVDIKPLELENIIQLAKANISRLKENKIQADFNVRAYEVVYLIDNRELEKAEAKALNLIDKYIGNKSLLDLLGSLYMELGKIYIFQQKLSSAQQSILKAIEFHHASQSDDNISLGWNYNALGSVYFYQGKYELAKDAFLYTISTWSKNTITNYSDLADIYLNLSFVAKKLKSRDKAISYQERALEVLLADDNTARSRLARAHIELANAYNILGKKTEAKPHFEAFGRLYDFDSAKLTDISGHSYYIKYLFKEKKSKLAFDWYNRLESVVQSNKLPQYIAFGGMDEIIFHYISSGYLDEAGTWISIRTERLVNYLLTISDDRKQVIDFLKNLGTVYFLELVSEFTLQKLEKAKSFQKNEVLNHFFTISNLALQPETLYSIKTGIESQQSNEARKVNNLMSQKSRLFSRISVGKISHSELTDINRQLVQIEDELAKHSGGDSLSSMLGHQSNLNEIQSNISNGTSLIQFFRSLNNSIAVLHITKDNAEFAKLEDIDNSSIAKMVEVLSNSIGIDEFTYTFEFPEYNQDAALKLNKVLFQKLKLRKNIVIVGNHKLSQLPFESLVTGSETTLNGKVIPQYLTEQHTFQYMPSLELIKPYEHSSGQESIAIGAPSLTKKDAMYRQSAHLDLPESLESRIKLVMSLGYLENASNELKFLESVVPKSDVLIETAATKENVLHVLNGKKKIVAFATHAVTISRANNQTLSALVLTPQPNLNDGLLTSEEIENLNLQADLVVLAACDTAMSDDGKTYDMSGLASSFLKAGSKRVLVTTRSVGDKATFILMTEFYKNLSLGYAEALQKGIEKLKEDHRYKHPFFWNAFRIIGVPEVTS